MRRGRQQAATTLTLLAAFLLAPETANKSLAELTTGKRPETPATIKEGALS
jgi:putative MFS transporter